MKQLWCVTLVVRQVDLLKHINVVGWLVWLENYSWMTWPSWFAKTHSSQQDLNPNLMEEIPTRCDCGCWFDMIRLSTSSWRLSEWYWISAKHPTRVYLVFLLIICNKRGNGCKWSVKRPYIIFLLSGRKLLIFWSKQGQLLGRLRGKLWEIPATIHHWVPSSDSDRKS